MPWSHRGNRRYFYRSCRVGQCVTKEYLGSGQAAEEVAADIERRRIERLAEANSARQYEQDHAQASAPLEELTQWAELLMKGTLLGLGYHQYDRKWRRRRGARS
jgi:hypothetical protein